MALLRARESVMVRFRPMLRAHGLTEQQWRVLRAMAAVTHRLRPMELSQATYISMPSLSRLLKTLEGRQLVERSRHASDMRGAEFELTAAGHAIVAEIAPHSSGPMPRSSAWWAMKRSSSSTPCSTRSCSAWARPTAARPRNSRPGTPVGHCRAQSPHAAADCRHRL